jgi:hypothetical protein
MRQQGASRSLCAVTLASMVAGQMLTPFNAMLSILVARSSNRQSMTERITVDEYFPMNGGDLMQTLEIPNSNSTTDPFAQQQSVVWDGVLTPGYVPWQVRSPADTDNAAL